MRDRAVQIGDVIRSQLDRGDLPERVRVDQPGRPAGETLTWSEGQSCYVSDITGECIWAAFIRQGWGLYFEPANPVHHQLELAG